MNGLDEPLPYLDECRSSKNDNNECNRIELLRLVSLQIDDLETSFALEHFTQVISVPERTKGPADVFFGIGCQALL